MREELRVFHRHFFLLVRESDLKNQLKEAMRSLRILSKDIGSLQKTAKKLLSKLKPSQQVRTASAELLSFPQKKIPSTLSECASKK
jgi:hypothetical protein